jgi:hypothetical protein
MESRIKSTTDLPTPGGKEFREQPFDDDFPFAIPNATDQRDVQGVAILSDDFGSSHRWRLFHRADC